MKYDNIVSQMAAKFAEQQRRVFNPTKEEAAEDNLKAAMMLLNARPWPDVDKTTLGYEYPNAEHRTYDLRGGKP